jgi:hypothetical protein
MFLSFIDFVTLGFLKKKKWLSKIYFPIYWTFSIITVSFLYRPLVYNFLDNRFGRRLSLTLVPIYFLILLGTSLRYYDSNYIDEDMSSSSISANNENYEDLLIANNEFVKSIFIQSKVITGNYIKVFIPYSESIENRVFEHNKGLKPEKDIRGLGSEITFNDTFDVSKTDSLRIEYLKTFNAIYSVIIDSTEQKTKFIIARSLKNKLGFETYIGIDRLENGKHQLKVSRSNTSKNDTTKWNVANIPFWYFID